VGTITEVYDYMRLLWARIGIPHCPVCGEVISKQSVQQIADQLMEFESGTRFQVLAPVISKKKGEFVGLVGESGSGKSTLGYALTRLQKPPARTNGGNIFFGGHDIRDLGDEELRQQRQGGFAMVLQSGMNALNPVRTIRNHFVDIFKAHGHVPRERWDARMKELIEKVKLPTAMLARFPGELSGGMRQRVSIALALSLEPRLMVFDEPTTALDVLVQH
ncbi:ATP-binding cassette domain-containing protein, partial [Bacillus sp. S34]|nr:ATP-binding cassette domain-containing protein [Bacillus sp. S34]